MDCTCRIKKEAHSCFSAYIAIEKVFSTLRKYCLHKAEKHTLYNHDAEKRTFYNHDAEMRTFYNHEAEKRSFYNHEAEKHTFYSPDADKLILKQRNILFKSRKAYYLYSRNREAYLL